MNHKQAKFQSSCLNLTQYFFYKKSSYFDRDRDARNYNQTEVIFVFSKKC